MPRSATVRACCYLIPILAGMMLFGVLVLALLPCIWLREATMPAARCDGMGWMDD